MLSEVGQQYHINNVKHISDDILLPRILVWVHYESPYTLYCSSISTLPRPQFTTAFQLCEIMKKWVYILFSRFTVHTCHPMLLFSNRCGDHLSICFHG